MNGTEKALTPKDASISLGIGDSTLRKWCIALENHGYNFPRTDNNRRVFFEKDMTILRHFRNLVQVQNFGMDNASLIVISKFNEETVQSENSNHSVPAIRDGAEVIQGLMDHIERQEEFNRKLLQRLDEQQNYIEERLNKRDELLMQSLRESQQTKKLLLEAKEAQEEKKQRKGIFKFFNKD